MDQRLSKTVWREGQPVIDADDGLGDPPAPSGFRFTFDDMRYILFRHKWKIITFALLGLAGAAVVYFTTPVFYMAETKLMVKYVTEMEPYIVAEGQGQQSSPSPLMRGETVVNAEVEILTSMDLAFRVAEIVGPERILAKMGGGSDLVSAASVIRSGTFTDVPRRSSTMIRLYFQHKDPSIVGLVLSNLVEQYIRKHNEVHRALASLEGFAQEREEVKSRLLRTEQDLWNLKKTNAVFSIEASKKSAAEQIFDIQKKLTDAETELQAREAALKSLQAGLPPVTESNDEGREERREEYRAVLRQLDQARRRKLDLLGQFVEGSGMVTPVQQQIVELENRKRDIERQDPTLLLATLGAGSGELDTFGEAGRISVLKARVDALRGSLGRAKAEEANLYELDDRLTPLQRTRDMEENKFRYLNTALEQAQIDSGLGPGRIPNIIQVERPTPPVRRVGPLFKRLAACAGGGLAVGIALALLMELFVDQSVRRPVELNRMLPLPLYISIPNLSKKGRRLLKSGDASQGGEPSNALQALGANGTDEYLRPFLEALRDRVLNRFEGLTHKPKLVGVCGCVSGSGVSSIAAGLAASLSEAGEAKVLLVDMKRGNGRAVPMPEGRKYCTLIEALEGTKRQDALVAPNLYVATANGSGSHQLITSPRKFTSVVPQLNTSDYDYIVFDMPPVNDVSITPRLAKHMDLTLLVVEAEKAHRGSVKEAGSLLLEFTPNVALVLNKTRAYLRSQTAEVA